MAELLTSLAEGMRGTVQICLHAGVGSVLIGAVVTAMRSCPVAALRWPADAAVRVLRRIPLAVVCFLVVFGLPMLGWEPRAPGSSLVDVMIRWPGSDLPYFRLFSLALALYTAAFVSDAIRDSVAAVPTAHVEQATVLGATPGQHTLFVVVPHTWRRIVVSVGRVLVTMIKNSALAGSFGVIGDLSQTVDWLTVLDGRPILAVLAGVSLAYYAMTIPAVIVLDRLERGLADTAGDQAPGVTSPAPRPRDPRLRYLINVVASAVVAYLAYAWLYRPMADTDQLSARLWAPMLDPGHADFAAFWNRIGGGVRATLTAATLAIIASLVCGTTLAALQVSLRERRDRPSRWSAVAAAAGGVAAVMHAGLTILRGLPVVITILVTSRALPALGVPLGDPLWYLVIGLTLHNMAAVTELLATGVRELPPSHGEAAHVMGATPWQMARLLLLPQASRAVLPALTTRLVVVLMDTSLGFIVGYEDLLGVARQVDGELRSPIQVYLVVAVIYLTLNAALAALVARTRMGERSVRHVRAAPRGHGSNRGRRRAAGSLRWRRPRAGRPA